MDQVIITPQAFSPEEKLSRFRKGCGSIGALAHFTGYCRAASHDFGVVTALELQHYPGFTQRIIADFAARVFAECAHGLIVHRVGMIAPDEAIVLVAAGSSHRAEAFKAVETAMDWLKTDAPFWKREHTQSSAHWIEPTHADYARRTKSP